MTKTANENKTHNLGKLRFTTGNECAVQEKSRLSICAKQNCDHNYLTHAQKRCNELLCGNKLTANWHEAQTSKI